MGASVVVVVVEVVVVVVVVVEVVVVLVVVVVVETQPQGPSHVFSNVEKSQIGPTGSTQMHVSQPSPASQSGGVPQLVGSLPGLQPVGGSQRQT